MFLEKVNFESELTPSLFAPVFFSIAFALLSLFVVENAQVSLSPFELSSSCLIAAAFGFHLAERFTLMPKAIPFALISACGLGSLFYSPQHEQKSESLMSFLQYTQSCKDSALVMAGQVAFCVKPDSETIRTQCFLSTPEQWSCKRIFGEDILASSNDFSSNYYRFES